MLQGPLHIDKLAAKRLIFVRALHKVPEEASLRIAVSSTKLYKNAIDFDLFFDSYLDKADLSYEANGEPVVLDKESAFRLIGSTLSLDEGGAFTLKQEE